jgi:predicted nucleotidyltransferase
MARKAPSHFGTEIKVMLQDAKSLTEIEKTALAEIKRRVSALFAVRQFVLFGSKARGDADPDSDIDLLMITEKRLSWQESHRITHEVFEVNLKHGTNFSYVNVDAETWNCDLWKYVPLHQNVESEGIPV